MIALVPALWAAAFALPLLAVVALVATRGGDRANIALVAAPLSLAPALALVLLPSAAPPGDAANLEITASGLLLGTTLALEPLGRTLLLVTVLLYGSALASLTFRHTERANDLAAVLLVCFVGNALVHTAADAVTFYLGFAIMSFAAYGAVVHDRTDAARRAGRIYLVLTVMSEFAVLTGLFLVVDAGGLLLADAPAAVAASPRAGLIAALLIGGFGVKAGLVPLHVWLPLAHPAAPPAASAVLSGAMVKAGLMGWLRFLPLGEDALREAGLVLTVLALVGAFAVVPLGALQRDAKTVLAYSTISQMGFLGAVVGVALAAPELAPAVTSAAGVYAVHHGLAKGALFLGVPVWKHHGSGRTRFLVVGGLVVAGLVVAGAPFTSGSVGKYAAKYAVGGIEVAGLDLLSLLPLVATGTTLLLLRFALLLWRSPADDEPAGPDPEVWAWLALVVTSAVVPFLVTNRWLPVADTPELDPVTLWDATWPILTGLAIGGLAAFLAARAGATELRAGEGEPVVPPGGVVVLYERAASGVVAAFFGAGAALGRVRERIVERAGAAGQAALGRAAAADRAEEAVSEWRGSGFALIATLAALALLGVVL